MENLVNPFKSQIQALGSQTLAAHKQVTDWQLGQLKLAEKQVASAMEIGRAGFEANVSAAQAMGKTLLDAMAPAETEKSA